MHFRILLAFFLSLLVASSAAKPAFNSAQELDGIMSKLDDALLHREQYNKIADERIDSLKLLLAEVKDWESRRKLLSDLGANYSNVNIDSAFRYFSMGAIEALNASDSSAYAAFVVQRAAEMPMVGEVKEALDEFGRFDSSDFNANDILTYFASGAKLHFAVSSLYPTDTLGFSYLEAGISFSDSIMAHSPESSAIYKTSAAHKSYLQGKTALFVASALEVIEDPHADPYHFAHSARLLGTYFRNQGRIDDALYYTTLSGISDLKSGTRTGDALRHLGEVLFEAGDVERAYACLNAAMNDALDSGTRLRSLEAVKFVPLVSQSLRQKNNRSRNLLTGLAIALGVLALVLIGVTVWLRREMRKVKRVQRSAAEANYMKDTYISQFLSLCSLYMEKFEEFTRVAKRKILAGQVDELYDMIKSGKIVDEQNKVFYDIFDNAFMHIYPTFVDDINRLLQPDRRITNISNSLTMELRIFAFMRLGIDDTAQIARFLGLTPNTIYTYRNKMRSRSIDRETFEANVMKIGQIY